MTVPDSTPTEVVPDWGEDVIYSEAVCHVDDVYFEGSEDHEYPDPAARKLRIEAAGQRYLEGHVPFLLSASLRGPFDKDSGWVNPWRSKQRARNPKPASPDLAWKGSPPPINESISQSQRGLTSDRLECHLPSPESLKQATVTAPHQYLEEDELAIVQSWRTSIHVPSQSQGSFWASTKAHLTASAKKRRAKESEWLKKVTNKKRKTDSSEPSFSKSPLVQRYSHPFVSTGNFGTSVHASPMRNPGRSFESAQRSKSRVQWHGSKDDEDDQSEQDELMDSTPDASFGSAHGPLAATPKRISPRRDMWKSAVFHTFGSEDELSQNEAAAATLSSPVSQRRQGRPTCALNANVAKQDPTASVGTQTSPLSGEQANKRGEVQHVIDLTDGGDEQRDEAMQNGDGPTAADFETQQDQSFCFRMRQKSDADSEKETAGEMLPDESNQPKVAGPLNPASAEPTPSPDVVDSTTMQEASEGDVDACSIEETEHSETTDKPGLQFMVQQPAEQMVQARPNCDQNAGSQDSTSSNTYKNMAQQADSPPSLIQLVQEDPQAAAPQETGTETSSASPMCVSREPDHACLDPALENDCQWGVDHAAAQEDAVPAPEVGHTVPAGAQMELQQDDHTNCSPGPVLSDIGCITARAVEAAEPVAALGSLGECVRPVDCDDVPMDKSDDTDPNEFSFKNILHRLVPSSPWTRLSQLTTRTASSPAPAAKVEDAADEDLVDTWCDFDAPDDANGQDSASSCSQQSSLNERNDSSTAEVMEGVTPSQSNSKTEPVAAATEPRLDGAPDEAVFKNALETNQTACLQEAPENIRIAESQQSPWTKTQLSQQVVLPASDTPTAITQGPSDDTLAGKVSQPAIPPAAQSPWSCAARIVVDAGTESATVPHEAACNPQEDGRAQDSQASRSEPRPSTPEPRFAFKSFASFMSPSPERTRRQTGLTRSQGRGSSLPSAIKYPCSDSRTNRRVSWALMPPGEDDEIQPQNLEGQKSRTPTARSMSRQGSPPPATPVGELPTSEDDKFNKHFAAIASRTDGLRQKLIPTASQQVAQSPGLHGMAETFLAADLAVNDTGAGENGEQVERVDTANPESQEPMDVVEDMFREMGDFLQVWDVDAELSQARKATNMGARQADMASRSPW